MMDEIINWHVSKSVAYQAQYESLQETEVNSPFASYYLKLHKVHYRFAEYLMDIKKKIQGL